MNKYLDIAPEVAAALAEGWRFSLSITHTQDTAIAFVTAWREGKEGAPCAL